MTNTHSGNGGIYPDIYFVRSAYLASVQNTNRGIIMLNGLVNGNYKLKIYPSNTNSAFDFASSYWPNMIYEANDSGAVPITFSILNNKTQYVEINCTVTDGSLILMMYVTASIYNAPQISILEIEKV